jgi:hypothetical protein
VRQPLSDFELRVPHACGVQGCGFSDPRFSLSHWPIPNCLFFARGVFRMEEKPEPFTKAVKSAAPENSSHPQDLRHTPLLPPIPMDYYGAQQQR